MNSSDIQKVKITVLRDEIGMGIRWNTYEKEWIVVSFIRRGNSGRIRFHREDYEFELRLIEFQVSLRHLSGGTLK